MKRLLEAMVAAALVVSATAAHATPSTTLWTPATTYSQPYLLPHITYDTYVAEKGRLQEDYGLTVGVLPFEKLQGEIGIDAFTPGLAAATGPTYLKDNFFLNAKLTLPENAFSPYQPGLSVGVMNVGFKKDYSDYDHLHATLGKTLPVVGAVAVGGYYGGNKKLYLSSEGKTERAGFMASWTSPDINIKLPGLDKVVLLADYASGKNAFGAFAAGVGFYFTPAIDLLTGPVWFNDKTAFKNGFGSDFMWTVQLDVDFDLAKPKPAPKA